MTATLQDLDERVTNIECDDGDRIPAVIFNACDIQTLMRRIISLDKHVGMSVEPGFPHPSARAQCVGRHIEALEAEIKALKAAHKQEIEILIAVYEAQLDAPYPA